MSTVGDHLPFSPETRARLQREWAAQEAREERAREKHRAELELQREGLVPHTQSESIAIAVAAQEGKVLHQHDDVLRKAAAAVDNADYQARRDGTRAAAAVSGVSSTRLARCRPTSIRCEVLAGRHAGSRGCPVTLG